MNLRNESLNEIRNILEPNNINKSNVVTKVKTENDTNLSSIPSVNALNSSGSMLSTANTEFIPHLFYCLHQIRKEKSSSANQFELQVGFIKHRLRNCKQFIENDESFKQLMSRSIDEWNEYIKQRECEMQRKKEVIDTLGDKIDLILGK